MMQFIHGIVFIAGALIVCYGLLAGGFCLTALADLTAEKARCMRIGNDRQQLQIAMQTEASLQQQQAINQAASQQLGARGVTN